MPTAEQSIIAALALRGGQHRSGEFYVNQQLALEFVQLADKLDQAVLGIEAFDWKDDGLHPNSWLVLDMDRLTPHFWDGVRWEIYRRFCNMTASLFIESVDPRDTLVFNFVLRDAAGWQAHKSNKGKQGDKLG